MSLSARELAKVADELSEALQGAVVQKVCVPTPRTVVLDLRQPGRTTHVVLCAEPKLARLSVAAGRGVSGGPGGLQALLRKHLVGERWKAARVQGHRVTLAFGAASLVGELHGPGKVTLLREGDALAPPPESAASGPDRLKASDSGLFPFARAAEALLDAAASQARHQAALRPLLRRKKQLQRTLEKVKAEAARQPLAEEHRRLGELLARVSGGERGRTHVEVSDYGPDGEARIDVALNPERTPQEESAWHFKQYRRLSRGVVHASARLEELAQALRRLEAQLAEPPAAAVRLPTNRNALQALPYREYLGTTGQRIWVGKGAQANDRLTFGAARPHHLWLHARGVPGAHVVLPLPKGAAPSQDALVDAAHLALFHSRLKGEPKGEVAYTQVKHVRRMKGGPPGQVTLSQERTFVLRLEPARLARLLQSAEASD